ncbi:FTR1 family iron permease [Guptibacillus hwajinpoensis]|uniref:High-affinity iron transporter n=1 Tax=Guptibacillus hwajinpoensis TaxID=208199 RepID=A0ABU0JYS6_9BACL|nr:FTR1 family protein [Alkalihalobacillus hemicentroti]MDQ0481376.1 high-affinity iron transporter [Alkalihalobacillus hemicentroti]
MEIQALLIMFREVLEALLIIGIITTYMKRMGQRQYNKFVWLGAGLAVLASVGVAMLFQVVFTGFAAMGSEIYLKIAIMLISAVLLTQMVFWMAAHSRDLKGKTEGKMTQLITTGNIVGMVIHSFLVVLREGVETVFFFAAITGGDIGKGFEGWGAITGVIIASAVSYFFFKGTMRIPLKSFFKVTGIFIVLIAGGLFVQGISMMQDIKMIGSVMPHVYDLTWFLPEHPIDYAHYVRDHGVAPLLSGDIGIFFKALFGYSSMPSLEEIVGYIGYFTVIYLLVNTKKEPAKASVKEPKTAVYQTSNKMNESAVK